MPVLEKTKGQGTEAGQAGKKAAAFLLFAAISKGKGCRIREYRRWPPREGKRTEGTDALHFAKRKKQDTGMEKGREYADGKNAEPQRIKEALLPEITKTVGFERHTGKAFHPRQPARKLSAPASFACYTPSFFIMICGHYAKKLTGEKECAILPRMCVY